MEYSRSCLHTSLVHPFRRLIVRRISPPPLIYRKGVEDSSSDDEDPEYVPSTTYRDPVVPPSKPAHVVATITVDNEPAMADFQRLLQLSSVYLDSASDLEEVD